MCVIANASSFCIAWTSQFEMSNVSENFEEETTIDPVAVIRLVRQLLPEEQTAHESTDSQEKLNSADGGHSDQQERQESAGCKLWDLATLEDAALAMVVS